MKSKSTLHLSKDTAIITLLIYYFQLFHHHFSTWYLPLVVLDLTYFAYLLNRMMKMFVWLFSLSIYSSMFCTGHLQEANGLLAATVRLLHENHRIASAQLRKIARNLRHFMTVNTNVATYLTYTNDEVWSKATGVLFVCQIPGNIYVVYRAMARTLNGSNDVHNWVILCNQLGMLFIALLLLARNSKVIHACHRHIPPLIAALQGGFLLYKLKYMDLYERLNSDQIIGISIGPFNAITYKMVFEVFAGGSNNLF